MQGIGRILAGAVLLAGAYVAPSERERAWAESAPPPADDTALAVPRITLPLGGNVPLPTPLSPSEAAQVRRVFGLQSANKLDQADRETSLLGDNLLLGHLRADRLLRQGRKAPVADLRAWLAAYSDHPEAPAVYALLLRLIPNRHQAPAAPRVPMLAPEPPAAVTADDIDHSDSRIAHNPALEATLAAFVRDGRLAAAEALLRRTRGLSAEYAAALHAQMARQLFIENQDAEAFDVASEGWNQDQRSGEPAYIAGLAAWRMGDTVTSRSWFEAAATAFSTTSSLRAAAAFWAARAAQKDLDHHSAIAWLARSAREQRSFYGLLANRLLGRPVSFGWSREVLGEAEVQAIAATPQGARAFALLQVGQDDLAEAEFRALWPTLANFPAMQRALLLVCDQARLTRLATQLSGLVRSADGGAYDLASLPVPSLKPAKGFTVDEPLVYALTRIESNFKSQAVSAAGASGLMQLTPTTASFVSAGAEESLHNPALNLEIGQRYLIYLARTDTVNADLVRLLAAYNAGPGAIARWDIADHGDPLLYIESIPVDETRAFVPRALAYSWIYAARFHLPADSLDTLAAGAWPQFSPRVLH